MFYKGNKEATLSENLFKKPTSEYRGAPFWAWNCVLDQKELDRQIDILGSMGFGGYHMHVREGLVTEYLSEEFFGYIKNCIKKGKENDMLSYLYDEDRWPSGFAGGFVTREKKYRAKYLLFTHDSYEKKGASEAAVISNAIFKRNNEGTLIARFDVKLDTDGYLESYKKLSDGENAENDEWFAYLETATDSPRYNNQAYVDTLDKKAIDRFIDITYKKYKEELGDDFGTFAPTIFTDEPQFSHKESFKFAESKNDVTLPWTEDIEESYEKAYNGEKLIDAIPELFWDLAGDKVSVVRYHYHDHVCERFVEAFADNCGKWCEENGIGLTGHMMREPSLDSQTRAIGETMRCYRHFKIPGIDMLCNNYELTTAKQCASAVHQYGREGMMSELYGVTSWDYDFRGHKLQGDWQAALGVTLRVPHLSLVSMKCESKRDYPSSINYQAPWSEKYSYIENHFARVCTAMTRGKPIVKVAVIHPVESYWLHMGPEEQTALVRQQLDDNFMNITSWLLYGSIDFDYISESLLPEQYNDCGNILGVGEMKYDVVIVPGLETIRKTTLDILEKFNAAGGKIIFAGSAPKYLDAVPSDDPKKFFDKCENIDFSKGAILSALDEYRVLSIRNSGGFMTTNLLHQIREDSDGKWLFIVNGTSNYNKDIASPQNIKISVKGHYKAVYYDTLTGEISDYPYSFVGGNTVMERKIYPEDSLLFKLISTEEDYKSAEIAKSSAGKEIKLGNFVPYTISEQNALLLDMAKYSLDGGELRDREEILRIDSIFRKELGWPLIGGGKSAQPWCVSEDSERHEIKLVFEIMSDIVCNNPIIALERPSECEVTFNGKKADMSADAGYFTDISIRKIKLPGKIKKGTNILEVKVPIGTRTTAEWCYLLGDFGVYVSGSEAKLVERKKTLTCGNIVNQTLPFYSGKLVYRYEFESSKENIEVRIPAYRAATALVSLDGGEEKQVTFAPHKAVFEKVSAGKHTLDVILYISRSNAFGPVHCANSSEICHSPLTWRRSGDSWSYEYNLCTEGLMVSPSVIEK